MLYSLVELSKVIGIKEHPCSMKLCAQESLHCYDHEKCDFVVHGTKSM